MGKLILNYAVFICVSVLCIAAFNPAHAQESVEDLFRSLEEELVEELEPVEPLAPGEDMRDIPDEFIDEAKAFEERCNTDPHLLRYYDCKCLSVKFLDQRIERGPSANPNSITLAIENECLDGTLLAGQLYMECLGGPFSDRDDSFDRYCQCFANTYADLFERIGRRPSSKLSVQIRTQSMITCKNPELAREIYPFIGN